MQNFGQNPILYIVILLAVWVLVEINLGGSQAGRIPMNTMTFGKNDEEDFSSGWEWADGTAADLSTLGETIASEGKQRAAIYKKLPSDTGNNIYLMFLSANLKFEVAMDGKVIYSYNRQQPWYVGHSPGYAYHSIRIPPDASGKTLSIIVEPVYSSSGALAEMFTGVPGSYCRHEMELYFAGYLLSLIILVIGSILLFLYFATMKTDPQIGRSFLGFAMTAVLMGFWSMEEAHIGELLFGHAAFWRAVTYLPLIFIPHFAFEMGTGWIRTDMKKYLRIVDFLVAGDIVFCVLAGIFADWDLSQCGVVIRGVIFTTFVILAYVVVKDLSIRIREDDPENIAYLITALVIIAGSTAWDYISDLKYGYNFADSFPHTRIGLMFMIVVLMIQYIGDIRRSLEKAMLTENFRRMAFRDPLTDLENRMAMIEMKKVLDRRIDSGDVTEILIGSVDLNYLKRVNDTEGHADGDIYLKTAASILRDVMMDRGSVYRTGGDEFLFFITGNDAGAASEEVDKQLREQCEKEKISMSWGMALWTKESGRTIDEVTRIADKRMYEMKTRMKMFRQD